jgi:hypothetical protein
LTKRSLSRRRLGGLREAVGSVSNMSQLTVS